MISIIFLYGLWFYLIRVPLVVTAHYSILPQYLEMLMVDDSVSFFFFFRFVEAKATGGLPRE